MIEVKTGDLLESQAQTLVNTVNCVGVMGKGIALEFRERYPEMYKDYVERCSRGEMKLGEPYLVRQLFGPWILNFPTKDHWRSISRIEDIVAGLDYLERHYAEWGITSIAMPPLGCGNGKLEWSEVGPILYQTLQRMGIPAELFAPLGTPSIQLEPAFLDGSDNSAAVRSAELSPDSVLPGWIAIVEIIKRLRDQPYHWPIGRTILQKIAFVATKLGIPTELCFRRSSYGPFAEDMQRMISRLVNSGLIVERAQQHGFQITVGDAYDTVSSRSVEVIAQWEEPIERVVDLFMRVRTTRDAELIATVMFAADELHNTSEVVTEDDVLRSVQEWKQRRNPPLDDAEIAETIRNLAAQKWIEVEPCADLPVMDPFELALAR